MIYVMNNGEAVQLLLHHLQMVDLVIIEDIMCGIIWGENKVIEYHSWDEECSVKGSTFETMQ